MTNRGVATHYMTTERTTAVGFDWYAGSYQAGAEFLVPALTDRLAPCEGVAARANPRYEAAWGIQRGQDRLVTLHWGKQYSSTLIDATGSSARLVVPVLRGLGVAHSVSRVDVAVDSVNGAPFLEVAGLAISLAEEMGLQVKLEGDWTAGVDGRTLYVGSKDSERRVCIYEKGIEQGLDVDWTRIELRVRPCSAAKSVYASMTCHQMLASHDFTRELLERLNIDVALAKADLGLAPRARRDVERARRALARQYHDHVMRWVDEVGSPDAFLGELARLHDEQLRMRDLRDVAHRQDEAAKFMRPYLEG